MPFPMGYIDNKLLCCFLLASFCDIGDSFCCDTVRYPQNNIISIHQQAVVRRAATKSDRDNDAIINFEKKISGCNRHENLSAEEIKQFFEKISDSAASDICGIIDSVDNDCGSDGYISRVRDDVQKISNLLLKENKSNGFAYVIIESLIQRAVCNIYWHNQASHINFGAGERLPLPDFEIFKTDSREQDANRRSLRCPKYASKNLCKSFQKETGIDSCKFGRAVVDMSGAYNMCGYRSILSQVDPSFFGGELMPGGRSVGTFEELEKICQLRLAIAIGELNESAAKFDEKTLLSELMWKCNRLGVTGRGPDFGEGLNGMLDTIFLCHLSKALNRTIAVISNLYVSYGGVGASLEVYSPHGLVNIYHSMLADDEDLTTDWSNTLKDKQSALASVLEDKNVIVLYHVYGGHFTAVQNIQQKK